MTYVRDEARQEWTEPSVSGSGSASTLAVDEGRREELRELEARRARAGLRVGFVHGPPLEEDGS